MKTKFLIFISSLIRAYEYPRIDGFVHTTEFKDLIDADGKPLGERYVYQGRALNIEEFNTAAARVFSETFPGEERTFRPFVIDPEAEAKHAKAKAERQAEAEAAQLAAEKAAAKAEKDAEASRLAEAASARIAAEKEAKEREIARQSKLAVEAHTRKLDAENAAEQRRNASEEAKALAAPVARPKAPIAAPTDETAPAFTLDGKNIMSDGKRVAGLFGDDKHLRVTSANEVLRPAIEAWLATNPQ